MVLFIIFAVFALSLCGEVQEEDVRQGSKQIDINEEETNAERDVYSDIAVSTMDGLNSVILYDAGLKGFSHKITIGNPPQKFVVHVSTYGSMLWIPHNNCSVARNRFNPSKSNTFAKIDQKWVLRNGTSGLLGGDTVKIGGGDEVQIVLNNSVFGMATNIPSGSLEVGFDGELGLGVVSEIGNLKPFIDQTLEKISQPSAMFTVFMRPAQEKLGYPTGFITYGSVDKRNCGQVIGARGLLSSSAYHYKMDGISMGNLKRNFPYEVVQDLGPFILGPELIIKQFADVAGAKYNNGLYEIGCGARFPSLEISIGSLRYSIPYDKLIMQVNNKCIFAMNTQPQGDLLWSFGAPFNRQYCVIFDIARKQIQFATTGANSTTARPPVTTPRANLTTRATSGSTRRTTAKKMSPSPLQMSFVLIGFTFLRQIFK